MGVRISMEDLREHSPHIAAALERKNPAGTWTPGQAAPYPAHIQTRTIGQTYERGMNKWEREYNATLADLHKAGQVSWYGFEAAKLKLAHRCYYTPDFLVVTADGKVEAHEVKGFWRDDARVKIKVAARALPWITFVAATKDDSGGWKKEVIPC